MEDARLKERVWRLEAFCLKTAVSKLLERVRIFHIDEEADRCDDLEKIRVAKDLLSILRQRAVAVTRTRSVFYASYDAPDGPCSDQPTKLVRCD